MGYGLGPAQVLENMDAPTTKETTGFDDGLELKDFDFFAPAIFGNSMPVGPIPECILPVESAFSAEDVLPAENVLPTESVVPAESIPPDASVLPEASILPTERLLEDPLDFFPTAEELSGTPLPEIPNPPDLDFGEFDWTQFRDLTSVDLDEWLGLET